MYKEATIIWFICQLSLTAEVAILYINLFLEQPGCQCTDYRKLSNMEASQVCHGRCITLIIIPSHSGSHHFRLFLSSHVLKRWAQESVITLHCPCELKSFSRVFMLKSYCKSYWWTWNIVSTNHVWFLGNSNLLARKIFGLNPIKTVPVLVKIFCEFRT